MRRVILETPYNGTLIERWRNRRYARACLKDSLRRGEAPIASHLLYPQVLNDKSAVERRWGIEAGLTWSKVAEAAVVYMDRGMSAGMLAGINRHLMNNVKIEYRRLNPKGDRDYAKEST